MSNLNPTERRAVANEIIRVINNNGKFLIDDIIAGLNTNSCECIEEALSTYYDKDLAPEVASS